MLEVSKSTRVKDIGAADESIFVGDRASLFRVSPVDLPPAEQRQEFCVRWTPASVRLVKFEYRQVNVPNRILEQTHTPAKRGSTVFSVSGEDFRDGGPVSAWRVSLWTGDQLLAEQKSALW